MPQRTITRRRRSAETAEPETETTSRSSRRGRTRAQSEDTPPAKEETTTRSDTSKIGKGWGSFEEQKTSGGDFAPPFKWDEHDASTQIIIKILDDEPVAVYQQYWVERSGKKSFVALGDDDPLAQLGYKPSAQAAFNVIDLRDPDSPEVKVWTVGQKVGKHLQNLAQDPKTSPFTDPKVYFAVNRTGSKGSYQTNIVPVKSRDLAEDWDIDPLTEDELEEFEEDAFEEEQIVYTSSWADLEQIATEVGGRR